MLSSKVSSIEESKTVKLLPTISKLKKHGKKIIERIAEVVNKT